MNVNRRPLSDRQVRDLRRSLGMTYYAMRNSRSVTLQNVQHEDSDVRTAALTMLDAFWQVSADSLSAICDEVIENDNNARVRGRAMQILGRLCRGTGDLKRSKVLAEAALNCDLPNELRSVAVYALHQINEAAGQLLEPNDVSRVRETVRTLTERGQALRNAFDLRVDWNWVASFCQ